jgi:hypothetical protein
VGRLNGRPRLTSLSLAESGLGACYTGPRFCAGETKGFTMTTKGLKKKTMGLGAGIACRMEAEIQQIKDGSLDLDEARAIIKARATQVQSVIAQTNDDKVCMRLAVLEETKPDIVDRTIEISEQRQVTRGLGLEKAA